MSCQECFIPCAGSAESLHLGNCTLFLFPHTTACWRITELLLWRGWQISSTFTFEMGPQICHVDRKTWSHVRKATWLGIDLFAETASDTAGTFQRLREWPEIVLSSLWCAQSSRWLLEEQNWLHTGRKGGGEPGRCFFFIGLSELFCEVVVAFMDVLSPLVEIPWGRVPSWNQPRARGQRAVCRDIAIAGWPRGWEGFAEQLCREEVLPARDLSAAPRAPR